jgi:hypothetical protein
VSSERRAARRVPLATPFGRQIQRGGTARDWVLSAALHGALVALIAWGGRELAEAGRWGGGGTGGGGGGRAFAVFSVPAAAAAPIPPPSPIVLPSELALKLPASVPETTTSASPAESLAQPGAEAAGRQGGGQGGGGGPGVGTGAGAGAGSGAGPGGADDGAGRIVPPEPQGIILPPTGAPPALRGVRLTVRFEISERGEVVAISVEPPIRDRSYRNEFMDRMRRYTFSPARTQGGRPVRAVFPVEITL